MLIDLGRKRGDNGLVGPDKPQEGPKVSYPGLHLDLNKLPSMKPGDTIEATVKLGFNGFRKNDYGPGKYCVDFDVMAIDLGTESKDEGDAGEKSLGEQIEEGLKEKTAGKK